MKRMIIIMMLFLPYFHISAQLPDADEIMDRGRELTLMGSLNANVNLLITEKNGATRNRTIAMTTKSYPGGLEKRLIRFLEPADVRGTSMLVIDNKDKPDEMWIYLPALKKTRRIVSSEKGKSFMSSKFSNADMSTPALSDFSNKHTANSGLADYWIIESIPVNDNVADEYGFSKKVSHIKKENYLVTKMEYYNFDDELFKTIEVRSYYPLSNGKYTIEDMAAINHSNGRKSEIQFTNLKENVEIDDSFFTIANLER